MKVTRLGAGEPLVHVGRCNGFIDEGQMCPGVEHYEVLDDGRPVENTFRPGPARYYFTPQKEVEVTCPRNIEYFADKAEKNPANWKTDEAPAAAPRGRRRKADED